MMKGTVWKRYTFEDGYTEDVRGGYERSELAAEERRHGKVKTIEAERVFMPPKAVRA
ncbi:MAG: hypothetical protein II264_04620 [Ruminococcus sp.]|nr:hypothetical protein [Ruminococcus sp.]